MMAVPGRGRGLMRLRRTAVTVAAVAAAVMAFATPASAYGPSSCSRSSCDLAAGPYTGDIYFEMPRNTAETMECWIDAQTYLGTNRWFKVSTVYGVGYTNANEVAHQTTVGHC
jgi:hypothetical protein